MRLTTNKKYRRLALILTKLTVGFPKLMHPAHRPLIIGATL